MANYAIVDNDTVINLIVAESLEDAESVSGHEAVEPVDGVPGIGWVRVDGVWTDPNAPVEEESIDPA